MQNHETPMARTTITIPADMLADAKAFDINLSRRVQEMLQRDIARLKQQRWAENNAEAIAAYNDDIRQNGLLLDGQGSW